MQFPCAFLPWGHVAIGILWVCSSAFGVDYIWTNNDHGVGPRGSGFSIAFGMCFGSYLCWDDDINVEGWAANFGMWPSTPKSRAGVPNYCSRLGRRRIKKQVVLVLRRQSIVSSCLPVVPAHLALSNITFYLFLFPFYYMSNI